MSTVVLSVFALVVAAIAVLALGLMLHWGRDREHGLVPYIFYPAVCVPMMGNFGRDLGLIELGFQLPQHPWGIWVSRVASLFLLVAATERIARRFVLVRKPPVPTVLIVAFVTFYLTNVVSSALFGTRPSFSHEYVYIALAGYAGLLVNRVEGDRAIECMRNALLFFLVVSALLVPFYPNVTYTSYHTGIVPGLTIRYAGLAPHANSMGPIAITFLLCLWFRPYARPWINRLSWTLGLASLVLCQSKTSWVAFILGASCIVLWRHGPALGADARMVRPALLNAAWLFMAMLAVSAFGVATMFFGIDESIEAFFDTRVGASLLTLTGRDEVWEQAVQEWRKNPIFGYGLSMFSDEYRLLTGTNAWHAHSQFYQTLSTSGIVGVTGLVIYALVLLAFVLKTAAASRGLTVGLFVLLAIHAVSEAPLSEYSLIQLVHVLLLMVIASRMRYHDAPAQRPEGATVPQPVHGLPASS